MNDESFLILLALLAVACVILGPIGFFLTLGARTRLSDAERKILSLESRLAQARLDLNAKGNEAGSAPGSDGTQDTRDATDTDEAADTESSEDRESETPLAHAARTSDETAMSEDAVPEQSAGDGWQWPGTTSSDGGTPDIPGEPDTAAPQAPKPGLEERLGTRWTVWIGGLALALGALLLVRYAIDQGYFGPGTRVILGLALAVVLIGMGERMRRSDAR